MNRTEVRVRYTECDPMGVAHHAAYPVWMEIGRTELLRAQGGADYAGLERSGVYLAVVRLNITYRKPARYDDVLTIETQVDAVGHVKIDHSYRIMRGGEELAIARTTLACLNGDGRPAALPEALRPVR